VKVPVARLIATVFGIGYARKGGGTLAAAVCCLAWWLVWHGQDGRNGLGQNGHSLSQALVTIVLFIAGVWSAGIMERCWGEDNFRIVIDEVAGMCLSLCFVPVTWPYVMAGFVLFRLLDITKPFFIRRMEGLRGGWGVMMDDMLAGLYVNLLLQVAVLIVQRS
jgi:phosphatidylglycerophosphatase A